MSGVTSPDEQVEPLGVRLRRARLKRGLSQVVLAGLSGVSPSFLSMVENGHRKLRSWSHITALASALDISASLLLIDRGEEPIGGRE